MSRRYAVAPALFAWLFVSGCARLGPPPSAPAPSGEETLEDAKVMVWDAPIAERTRVEVWIRAGSLDGGAPLVASTMAEIWAARTSAEPWVTPSLTVLAREVPRDELEAETARLLETLADPPREEELEAATAAVTRSRRRQSHAPEREAIAAAFSGMGLPLALPLGEEGDPAPPLDTLRAYARAAIGDDSVRVLFIGEAPERLVKRTERAIDRLDPSSSRRGRHRSVPGTVGVREASPAWALVVTLDSLDAAARVRALAKAGPRSLGDARVELAPSHLGAFLVVSGRGAPSAERLRGWVLEIRRLASWSGPSSVSAGLDLRERARAHALRYAAASSDPSEEPRFSLGVAVPSESELEREALEEALAATVEPAPVASDEARSPDTSVVARFPALFSGEPASDAGRGALLLRALADHCRRAGLDVVASAEAGDGLLAFTFLEGPRLGEVQALARCLLRRAPGALSWEAVRARLLDELARDPLHPALEAIAAALYPSAPSSALPLQTRALRHRSGDGRMAEALAARRARGGVHFAVSGPSHLAVGEQLGAILAALPAAPHPPRPLDEGAADLGPGVVELNAPGVFVAGVRLATRSPWAARAFAASWATRARARGLAAIRVLSGGHPSEGFAALVVPSGESDPEALRAALEAASPSESEFRDVLREIERDWAYRPKIAGEPPVEAASTPLPRVTGRAYVIGAGAH